MDQSLLLKLPPELQLDIYEHVLKLEDPIQFDVRSSGILQRPQTGNPYFKAIMQTCTSIKLLCGKKLFTLNSLHFHVYFEDISSTREWLPRFQQFLSEYKVPLRHIRHVVFLLGVRDVLRPQRRHALPQGLPIPWQSFTTIQATLLNAILELDFIPFQEDNGYGISVRIPFDREAARLCLQQLHEPCSLEPTLVDPCQQLLASIERKLPSSQRAQYRNYPSCYDGLPGHDYFEELLDTLQLRVKMMPSFVNVEGVHKQSISTFYKMAWDLDKSNAAGWKDGCLVATGLNLKIRHPFSRPSVMFCQVNAWLEQRIVSA